MMSGLSAYFLHMIREQQPRHQQNQTPGQPQSMVRRGSSYILPISARAAEVARRVPQVIRWDVPIMTRIARATTTAMNRNGRTPRTPAPVASQSEQTHQPNAPSLAQRRLGRPLNVVVPIGNVPKPVLMLQLPSGSFRLDGPRRACAPTLSHRRKGKPMQVRTRCLPLLSRDWNPTAYLSPRIGEPWTPENWDPAPTVYPWTSTSRTSFIAIGTPFQVQSGSSAHSQSSYSQQNSIISSYHAGEDEEYNEYLYPPPSAMEQMIEEGRPTRQGPPLVPFTSPWMRASSWNVSPSSFNSPADSTSESAADEEAEEESPARNVYAPVPQMQLTPGLQQWLRDYQSRQQAETAESEESTESPDSASSDDSVEIILSAFNPWAHKLTDAEYIQAAMQQWTWTSAKQSTHSPCLKLSPFSRTIEEHQIRHAPTPQLISFPRFSQAESMSPEVVSTPVQAEVPSPVFTGYGLEANMQTCSPAPISAAPLRPRPANIRLPPSANAPPIPPKSLRRRLAQLPRLQTQQSPRPSPIHLTRAQFFENPRPAPAIPRPATQRAFRPVAPSPSTILLPRFFPLRGNATTAIHASPQIMPLYKRLSSQPMSLEAAVRAHVRANETRHVVLVGLTGSRLADAVPVPAPRPQRAAQEWRSNAMNSGMNVGRGVQSRRHQNQARMVREPQMPTPVLVYASPVAAIAEFRRRDDGVMEIVGCNGGKRPSLRRRVVSFFRPFFGSVSGQGQGEN